MNKQNIFILITYIVFGLSYLVNINTASANSLVNKDQASKGSMLVKQYCTRCHSDEQITNSSGYSADGWKELTRTMIDLSADPAVEKTIINYLAASYPPHTKRSPTLMSGDTKITFTQWQTPTLGQRSRDPVEAPNGIIWWAGQRANLIGKLNPETGEMKEYLLPNNAMPHTVSVDTLGHVWYTGNKNGTVGKLNPNSEKITEFTLPDVNASDPHTAVFDKNGILWFTLQHSNMIGRLNPKTSDIKLVTMTTEKSKPYGIKIDANGVPWVACNGSNCLVKVDPETMALTEIKLPNTKTKVRRLDIADNGLIWYVNSSQGRLGQYNPSTGEIKEWPSPSGKKSHPYAIVVVDNIVWYNESGMRPDALVRFDPKTEAFQSWAIPSGNVYAGIIRHMRATKNGDLLIHQSSTNKIIRVNTHELE